MFKEDQITTKEENLAKEPKSLNKKEIIFSFFALAFFPLAFLGLPEVMPAKYNSNVATILNEENVVEIVEKDIFIPIYIETPNSVKGVYMTSWVAGTPSIRQKIVDLVEETELNTIVIDIKDDTGRISFAVEDEMLNDIGSPEVRIPDAKEFIKSLNQKGVYVIGRISVFQDPYLIKLKPELAVKRASDGEVWGDRKGIGWLDAGSREAWDYTIAIAKEAHKIGFDELNFDYIRFPSDGNMRDIYYPFSEEKILADPNFGKAEVIKDFFAYLDSQLNELGIVVSADLFGMTTTNKDDLNIGQVLENALPYFDYIAPMVYPSHYPTGFNGYINVNQYPYEIVNYSMSEAVKRVKELKTELASSTPDAPYLSRLSPSQLRPWLQDNDYPVHYTPEMVRAQINATYDAGLNSWILWDAANTYTRAALFDEGLNIESQ
jgi:hypothetical protein